MKANRQTFSTLPLAAIAVAGASLCAGTAASAQSINDWQLPSGKDTPRSTAQGPVDAQNPVVTPRVEPSQSPSARPSSATPTPTPRPTLRPNVTPTTAPTVSPVRIQPPRDVRGAATPAPAPTATHAPAAPASSPAAPGFDGLSGAAPRQDGANTAAPLPAAEASPAPAPVETAPAQVAPDSGSVPWGWIVAALALLALAVGGALAFFKRRAAAPETYERLPEVAPAPRPHGPEPSAPAKLAGGGTAMPATRPAPAPAQVLEGEVLSLAYAFEPALLRLSLVFVTLSARLRFENRTGTVSQPIELRGDMIGAHASMPATMQVAPDPAGLGVLGHVPALQPGESHVAKLDLRLPINAVRAIVQGEAAYMAPLVRIALMPEIGNGERRAFTLGLAGMAPGRASIRVDTGPGEHQGLAAREIEAARRYTLAPRRPAALPLDPVRAAS